MFQLQTRHKFTCDFHFGEFPFNFCTSNSWPDVTSRFYIITQIFLNALGPNRPSWIPPMPRALNQTQIASLAPEQFATGAVRLCVKRKAISRFSLGRPVSTLQPPHSSHFHSFLSTRQLPRAGFTFARRDSRRRSFNEAVALIDSRPRYPRCRFCWDECCECQKCFQNENLSP